MTRTLTITAAEWASVRDGTLWLVRQGAEDDLDQFIREENLPVERGPLHPPVEFVEACAPCATCKDTRECVLPDQWQAPCPDCRIELEGSCSACNGDRLPSGNVCECYPNGTVTVGYGYAVGEALLIREWPPLTDGPTGTWIAVKEGHRPVIQRCDGHHRHTTPMDRNALAHYGPPESLVGKWALQVQVVEP